MARVWSWHITIHIYSEPVKQRWQWGGVSRCGLNCRVTSATPSHHPAHPSSSASQHLNIWPRFLSWRCLKQRCAASSIYNCTQAYQYQMYIIYSIFCIDLLPSDVGVGPIVCLVDASDVCLYAKLPLWSWWLLPADHHHNHICSASIIML